MAAKTAAPIAILIADLLHFLPERCQNQNAAEEARRGAPYGHKKPLLPLTSEREASRHLNGPWSACLAPESQALRRILHGILRHADPERPSLVHAPVPQSEVQSLRSQPRVLCASRIRLIRSVANSSFAWASGTTAMENSSYLQVDDTTVRSVPPQR
jgi:hypothetical protein